MSQGNREFTSSVFALLFGEIEKLIELYNAVEGTDYGSEAEVIINTLENALFLDRCNDISFTINGRLIVIFEHQKSLNKNMPLRILIYIARLYEKLIESRAIYKEQLVKIPAPEFIVFYNGDKDYPKESILKLSDAFLEESKVLEVEVKVLNINYKENAEILEKSRTLKEYSYFIQTVKDNKKSGMDLTTAIATAVKHCIEEGILEEFLQTHGSEVENMLFTEFNLDDLVEVRVEETKEEFVQNAISEGLDDDTIQRLTKLPMEKIMEIRTTL